MPPFVCFICSKEFNLEKSCYQHANDVHGWPFIANPNWKLHVPGRWVCPYCKKTNFQNVEIYFHHVLNNCSATKDQRLYMARHDAVLRVILDAVTEEFGCDYNWKINSVVKNQAYYQLPCGIQNKPGSRSPDLLLYNKKKKYAAIVELSVPWETNAKEARNRANEKMKFWADQFKYHNYTCVCHTVEIGSRGLVYYTLYDCLKNLHVDEENIIECAWECQETVMKYSQYLINGYPEGPDEEESEEEEESSYGSGDYGFYDGGSYNKYKYSNYSYWSSSSSD